jgi:hypothetical protein
MGDWNSDSESDIEAMFAKAHQKVTGKDNNGSEEERVSRKRSEIHSSTVAPKRIHMDNDDTDSEDDLLHDWETAKHTRAIQKVAKSETSNASPSNGNQKETSTRRTQVDSPTTALATITTTTTTMKTTLKKEGNTTATTTAVKKDPVWDDTESENDKSITGSDHDDDVEDMICKSPIMTDRPELAAWSALRQRRGRKPRCSYNADSDSGSSTASSEEAYNMLHKRHTQNNERKYNERWNQVHDPRAIEVTVIRRIEGPARTNIAANGDKENNANKMEKNVNSALPPPTTKPAQSIPKPKEIVIDLLLSSSDDESDHDSTSDMGEKAEQQLQKLKQQGVSPAQLAILQQLHAAMEALQSAQQYHAESQESPSIIINTDRATLVEFTIKATIEKRSYSHHSSDNQVTTTDKTISMSLLSTEPFQVLYDRFLQLEHLEPSATEITLRWKEQGLVLQRDETPLFHTMPSNGVTLHLWALVSETPKVAAAPPQVHRGHPLSFTIRVVQHPQTIVGQTDVPMRSKDTFQVLVDHVRTVVVPSMLPNDASTPWNISLRFDGTSLGVQETPESQDMEEGDLIDVILMGPENEALKPRKPSSTKPTKREPPQTRPNTRSTRSRGT